MAERRTSQGRPGHVTNVDKANVFHSMAFWRQIFEERANQFPGIEASSAYVDAMALNLVLKPWQYDVLVRSEERRVGNECVSTCRSRWALYHEKKNKRTGLYHTYSE